MEDLPIFQERLLLARRRAGVSQGELATRTAMYASDISKMERGRMLPTAPRLRRLAAALGVSADYLLGLIDDPPVSVLVASQTASRPATPQEDPHDVKPTRQGRRVLQAAPVA